MSEVVLYGEARVRSLRQSCEYRVLDARLFASRLREHRRRRRAHVIVPCMVTTTSSSGARRVDERGLVTDSAGSGAIKS
jgi:hypothetical protein